jgi:hypothetical protein
MPTEKMTVGRTIRIAQAGCWLTGLAFAGLLAASAPAQVETVPIHFSKPFEPILSTNLNALVGADKQKTFQEVLKDSDSRSISGIFREDLPVGSMAMPNRPRMSAAAAQKYREAADRKKNWAFTIESDIENDPKLSQLVKFMESESKEAGDKQRNVYQDFYDRLERESLAQATLAAEDPRNPNRQGMPPDLNLATANPDGDPTGFSFPGGNPASESLLGSGSAGDTRNLPGARSRDLLNLGTKRDAMTTTSTRQATDFKDYERDPSAGGLTSASQRARLEAFKSMFDSTPVASAAPQAKPASPLSSALNSLGLPAPSLGVGSAASGAGGSFIERFNSTAPTKSSSPVSTPLPSYNNTFPTTPTRGSSTFPNVPTRRQ